MPPKSECFCGLLWGKSLPRSLRPQSRSVITKTSATVLLSLPCNLSFSLSIFSISLSDYISLSLSFFISFSFSSPGRETIIPDDVIDEFRQFSGDRLVRRVIEDNITGTNLVRVATAWVSRELLIGGESIFFFLFISLTP